MGKRELCTFKSGGTTNPLAKIRIPYETAEDREVYLDLELEEHNLSGTFIPKEQPEIKDIRGAVAKAVENPIAGKKLSEILLGAKKVTIITENQFRQAPITEIVPYLLNQIKASGATAKIVIGCGKVPALSPEEIAEKFGPEVVNTGVEIFSNDVSKPENYVYTGRGVKFSILCG